MVLHLAAAEEVAAIFPPLVESCTVNVYTVPGHQSVDSPEKLLSLTSCSDLFLRILGHCLLSSDQVPRALLPCSEPYSSQYLGHR